MQIKQDQDGWAEDSYLQEHSEQPLSFRYRQEHGLSLLQGQHHSLEPDMMFGWKPKLPCCPLPLSYRNCYVDEVVQRIRSDDRFQLAYLGPRFVNSVQINQQYQYFWKYRTRYSLNLALVKDAIQKVGSSHNRKIELEQSEFTFDSSFESGNLDVTVRVKKNEYDCFLRSDTNTQGHTSWYYFKVSNGAQIGALQLNICNFGKTSNLYNHGMRPYVLNGKNGQWSQLHCYDVIFVERFCRYSIDTKTYQLQFKYDFTEPNQTVCFAYSIPYTYSQLQLFIREKVQAHPHVIQTQNICETLGGVDLPLLIITNPQKEEENVEDLRRCRKKKAVLMTARIHPGESNSSHLMQGFIESLLERTKEAEALRNSFVFYLIPMLNPDGVIVGNFRTSYSGKDLNRQFSNLNKFVFPEVTALHDLALRLKKYYKAGFDFFFDFHGHSSKKGLFCYGPEHPAGKIEFFKCRALAKMMQEQTDLFSYKRCIFTISEHKKSTGRAHMLNKLKIPMTFTFEISSGLYDSGQGNAAQLALHHLIRCGKSIVNVLFRYAKIEMNIPLQSISAKIDTGILKKRTIYIAKTNRNRKQKTLKELSNNSNGQTFHGKSQMNLKNRSQESHEVEVADQVEKEQFLKLMKEIKMETLEKKIPADEMEGGSDSEAEEQDLDSQDLKALYQLIEKKNSQPTTYEKLALWKHKNQSVFTAQQKCEAMEAKPAASKTRKIVSSKYLESTKTQHLKMKRKSLIELEMEKAVLPGKNFAMEF